MKRLLAVALGLFLALTLAACGSSPSVTGLSAAALRDKARQEVGSAQYVTLSGTVVVAGAKVGLDMHYTSDTASGTMTYGGQTLGLRRIGKDNYLQISKAFFVSKLGQKVGDAVAAKIDGRWVHVTGTGAGMGQLASSVDKVALIDRLLDTEKTPTKGAVTSIDGVRAIPLRLPDSILYINASNGRPLVVRGAGASAGATGELTFDYSSFTPPTAPPANDQIDSSALG